MLQTTLDAIRSILKTDPTISPIVRQRLLTALLGNYNPVAEINSAKEDRIISRKEAASRLSLSPRGIDNLAMSGAIQKRFLPGRKRAHGFLESDVQALVAGCATTSSVSQGST